jgi:NADH-quinone oxidoreductase subunit N
VTSLVSVLLAVAILVWEIQSGLQQTLFLNSYLVTPLINLGKCVVLVAGLLTLLASRRYVEDQGMNLSEYIFFLASSLLGMSILLSANDFLLFFLGLEFLSFPIYILTGMKTQDARSCEAGLKYIVMGAFSSGWILFGIGLIYGATATTNLTEFTNRILSQSPNVSLSLALIFLLVGFGFKLSLVPFHAWTPDAYEGAPTTITAFMSVTIKVALFFLFIRMFAALQTAAFLDILAALALLSIVVGNFYGLLQENVKRLIAYSAIAHAGYILLGFLDSNRQQGSYAMVFYLLNYTFMNLAALFVLVYLTTREKYVETLTDLKGVGVHRPFLGLVMIVAVLSLAGLPPTPGFLAKFYIFKSAIQGGYILTVVVALISTVVSLYYYLKILVVMYMEEGTGPIEKRECSVPLAIGMGIAILALFYIGIFPNQLLGLLPLK